MEYESRIITPFEGDTGLEEYHKPFLIGYTAFPVLTNVYPWRGSVRKREGYKLLGTVPTVPVQGLRTFTVQNTGDDQLIAFSTTKAYLFNNTTSVFDNISFFQTSGAAISWTGSGNDYFWTTNYARSMWASNNVDNLRFYNGSTTQGWNNQRPIVNGSTTMTQCLMMIPYKGRLVVLSTTEGGVVYRQRARWSQIGTPYVPASGADPVVVPPSPFTTDADAWRDDIVGRGGFIDAPTNQRIVSAGIVRDTLIVFFQQSTWRLRYTGNEVLPFVWEQINTQYGSEGTFSTISFDEALLTFSRFGFVAADTNTVRRIDERIPDQSFEIEAGTTIATLQAVNGIRDFYRQNAYWAYQNQNTGSFNDRVLVYSYLDRTWARFDQHFRVFGYYRSFNDLTWGGATFTWEGSNNAWFSPWQQSNFPQVVAANADPTNGEVYVVYDFENEGTDNGTAFNFELRTKWFNPYFGESQRCKLGYVDLYCTRTVHGEVTVNHYTDDNEATPIVSRTVNLNTLSNASYVRIPLGGVGRNHQLQIRLSDAQMDDPEVAEDQFEMQAMVVWTRKQGRIRQ